MLTDLGEIHCLTRELTHLIKLLLFVLFGGKTVSND